MDDIVHIEVKRDGITYAIPGVIWRRAVVTFDQQYRLYKGRVPLLARLIGNELMPANNDDPFSAERLARCLLAHKGSRARKPASGQGTLFGPDKEPR